jgi:hypothetical protein
MPVLRFQILELFLLQSFHCGGVPDHLPLPTAVSGLARVISSRGAGVDRESIPEHIYRLRLDLKTERLESEIKEEVAESANRRNNQH